MLDVMWRDDVQRLTIIARDGARLCAYTAGEGGPALVLASGLGGPVSAWRYQFEHFSKRYRVLSWDYRGLYASANGQPNHAVDVATQASDLECLLEQTGARRAIVVGWSMGVQVALEHHARWPERTSHLVLINGTSGRPFETLPLPGAARVLPSLLRRARRYHHTGSRLLKRAARTPVALDLVQRVGSLTTALRPELLEELALEFAHIDVEVYLRTLQALGEHQGDELLEKVRVPTLVIAGARDRFTPHKLARRMVDRLPQAELLVLPRGTHYIASEFPELVNQRIDAFLERHAGHGLGGEPMWVDR
jgi:pimeloyl-ACP methyl ester carboxylesterase